MTGAPLVEDHLTTLESAGLVHLAQLEPELEYFSAMRWCRKRSTTRCSSRLAVGAVGVILLALADLPENVDQAGGLQRQAQAIRNAIAAHISEERLSQSFLSAT